MIYFLHVNVCLRPSHVSFVILKNFCFYVILLPLCSGKAFSGSLISCYQTTVIVVLWSGRLSLINIDQTKPRLLSQFFTKIILIISIPGQAQCWLVEQVGCKGRVSRASSFCNAAYLLFKLFGKVYFEASGFCYLQSIDILANH